MANFGFDYETLPNPRRVRDAMTCTHGYHHCQICHDAVEARHAEECRATAACPPLPMGFLASASLEAHIMFLYASGPYGKQLMRSVTPEERAHWVDVDAEYRLEWIHLLREGQRYMLSNLTALSGAIEQADPEQSRFSWRFVPPKVSTDAFDELVRKAFVLKEVVVPGPTRASTVNEFGIPF